MRRTLNGCFLAAAIAAAGLSLAGCKQDAGQRCEVQSDCAAGLMCLPGDMNGGICSANPAAPIADAAPTPAADGSVAPDQGVSPDLAAAADGVAADGPAADAPVPADVAPDMQPDRAPDVTPAAPDSSSN
jgi:hypothetical protein